MQLNSFFLIFIERKVKTRNDSDFSRSREAEISSFSMLFRFLPQDGVFYGGFFKTSVILLVSLLDARGNEAERSRRIRCR